MDPNVTLAAIRDLVTVSNERALTITESNELCERIEALDEWLSKGGFSPEPWRSKAGA